MTSPECFTIPNTGSVDCITGLEDELAPSPKKRTFSTLRFLGNGGGGANVGSSSMD